MSLDATMERALNRNIIVTVNIIVLTALMSSTAVRKLQIPCMWLLGNNFDDGFRRHFIVCSQQLGIERVQACTR